MNNTLSLIIATGIGFGVGTVAGYAIGHSSTSSEFPLIPFSSSSSSHQVTKPSKGVDHYEIKFLGTPGQHVHGSYAVTYAKIGAIPKVREVEGILPYTVKFSLYKGSVVTANISALDSSGEIKIFRNGTQCDKPLYEGKYAQLNKSCGPDRISF